MKAHPLAELFPPIGHAALMKLAEDIAANGLQEPIWIFDGQILDGRNRWNACRIAQVECRTVEYVGDDPLGFVISLNLHRRQLTPSQLAIIGVEVEAERAKEARQRRADLCRTAALTRGREPFGSPGTEVDHVPQRIGDTSGTVTSAGTRRNGRASGGVTSEGSTAIGATNSSTSRDRESARQAARVVGVNHDYISKAKRIARDAPELVELVKSGQLSLHQAALLARVPPHKREQIFPVPGDAPATLKTLEEFEVRLRHALSESRGGRRWVPAQDLSRLRHYFSRVLRRYVENANGEFSSLTDCLGELMRDVEKASRQFDEKPETTRAESSLLSSEVATDSV